MTLVLATLAQRYIVLAADRRLTMPDGSVVDDDANKAVFYCGRIAIGYCGLAQLGPTETSQWLGEVLVNFDTIEPAMEHVAERLTGYFRRSRERDKRIAFMAVGWATFRGQGPARPFCSITSNFLSGDGRWLPCARSEVRVNTRFLDVPREKVALVVAGQPLHPVDALWLTRQSRRSVEHNTGPVPRARLLGEMIRAVSRSGDRRSPYVGSSLLIQSLCWDAVEQRHGTLYTPLSPGAHSFLYMAADGSTDTFKGPIYVCGGGMLANLQGGTIPPGETSFLGLPVPLELPSDSEES